MPVSDIETAPPQRNIDPSDLAFNAVLEPLTSGPTATATASEPVNAEGELSARSTPSSVALAAALNLSAEDAEAMVRSAKPIPVARCQTRQEAEMIANLIESCGFNGRIVGDEELNLGRELTRARRITLDDDGIKVHASSSALTIRNEDLKLLVMGALRRTRVDYSEAIIGARGKDANLVDSAQFSSDEILVDVYTSSLDSSFRVRAEAFDYSGLVEPLSFRAEANLKSAIEALIRRAPQTRVDSDFTRVRSLLSRSWPERSRNESRGIRRTGLSFRPVSQQSILSDNSDQFERYSRLMLLFA
ncbi:MAG TPA: hypothetical protein VKM94_23635 [Blastocatellia bacterium]|nr:hypothetical protein [Blastocatellia bacterium]